MSGSCPSWLCHTPSQRQWSAIRSKIVQAIRDSFALEKIFSSAYYPQADGHAKRFMRTLNNSLSVLSRDDRLHWNEFVPGLNFAYNMTAHVASHLSPFEMCTGRVPNWPGEHSFEAEASQMSYLRRLRSTIRNHHARVRELLELYWARMKRAYDLPGSSPTSVLYVLLVYSISPLMYGF